MVYLESKRGTLQINHMCLGYVFILYPSFLFSQRTPPLRSGHASAAVGRSSTRRPQRTIVLLYVLLPCSPPKKPPHPQPRPLQATGWKQAQVGEQEGAWRVGRYAGIRVLPLVRTQQNIPPRLLAPGTTVIHPPPSSFCWCGPPYYVTCLTFVLPEIKQSRIRWT